MIPTVGQMTNEKLQMENMENGKSLLCARLYTALDSRASTNEFDITKMRTKAPIVTEVRRV